MLDKGGLRRGETGKAEACVLLANKNSKQALQQDFRNILQALSIKRCVYDANKGGKEDEHHNMKIVMQLIKPESKVLYKKSLNLDSIHDQLIIVEEIKMNLLAKSCFAPGLIAMISNLVSSMSDPDDEFEEQWLNEYVEGTGFEIYRVKIDEIDFLSCLTFGQVAGIAHQCYGCVVFALEVEFKERPGVSSVIRLNPADFKLQNWRVFNYYLYIISGDEDAAKKVQRLVMSDEKYKLLLKQARRPRVQVRADGTLEEVGPDAQPPGTARSAPDADRAAGLQPEDASAAHNYTGLEDPAAQAQSATNRSALQSKNSKGHGQAQFADRIEPAEVALLFPQSPQQETGEKSKFQGPSESAAAAGGPSKSPETAPKKDDCLRNAKPITQMEASDERKLSKLKDHIVVCGIHTSILYLILPLRAKYLRNYLQDIVIINPTETVPKHIWDTISCFQRIFLIYGSPLDRNILRQAQIQRAAKAVIMSDDPSLVKQESTAMTNEMLDAKNIFIYKAIKKINPTLQIITELSYSSNIEFLQERRRHIPSYIYQKMYTAGEVYISSIIDTLTAQACYNPHIVTIL